MTFGLFGLKSAFVIFLTLILISGCSLLPDRVAKKTFMLPAPGLAPSGQPTTTLTLRVLTPQAEEPLDGTQILVNPDGQTIQAYGGVRWIKITPILIRDHWVEGLRQSGGFNAVVSETSSAMSELSLSSELTRFQVHYPQGAAEIVIQLDAQVLDSQSRRVIAAQRFRVQWSIADQPIETVVAGFGEASQALTQEMADWLLSVSRELYEETDQARPPSGTGSSTRK